MTSCPQGHESEWADWCSVCGERLDAATSAALVASAFPSSDLGTASPDVGSPTAPSNSAAAATGPDATAPASAEKSSTATVGLGGPACTNCGDPAHAHAAFCESCGYDFASGTLPVSAEAVAAGDPASSATSSATAPAVPGGPQRPLVATVSIDSEFFGATTADVELTLPDPLPDPTPITLSASRNLVGRHSASRGILPEIDVEALTADPGVSSRHVMFERSRAGAWSFTDLGSTNGTYLSSGATAEPITPGAQLLVADAMSIWLGAWTRLDLAIPAASPAETPLA